MELTMLNCIYDAIVLPWLKFTGEYVLARPKHTWGNGLPGGYSWLVTPVGRGVANFCMY